MTKKSHVAIFVITLLLLDQILKFYIKLNFYHGQSVEIFGKYLQLTFVENPGMAWGLNIGGIWGKLALTIFRLIAVILGTGFLMSFVEKKMNKWFIVCASLIYAGAIGNLIDSIFYGSIFDRGLLFVNGAYQDTYEGIAKANFKGYTKPFLGNVVDMIHCELFTFNWPKSFPWVGGKEFKFFGPVFNIADACISVGVISIFIFQNIFFGSKKNDDSKKTVETNAVITDEAQIQ